MTKSEEWIDENTAVAFSRWLFRHDFECYLNLLDDKYVSWVHSIFVQRNTPKLAKYIALYRFEGNHWSTRR